MAKAAPAAPLPEEKKPDISVNDPRNNPVSLAARRLKNGDPQGYDQFVAAFRDYANYLTVAVCRAEAGMILNAQGQAQDALKVLRLLTELPE